MVIVFNGEAGTVRLGDIPLKPGDTIAGPPEVVAELSLRSDFEVITEPPAPKPRPKKSADPED